MKELRFMELRYEADGDEGEREVKVCNPSSEDMRLLLRESGIGDGRLAGELRSALYVLKGELSVSYDRVLRISLYLNITYSSKEEAFSLSLPEYDHRFLGILTEDEGLIFAVETSLKLFSEMRRVREMFRISLEMYSTPSESPDWRTDPLRFSIETSRFEVSWYGADIGKWKRIAGFSLKALGMEGVEDAVEEMAGVKGLERMWLSHFSR